MGRIGVARVSSPARDPSEQNRGGYSHNYVHNAALSSHRSFAMKSLPVFYVALVIGLSTTAAFGRGGMGHMMGPSSMPVTGGALGTSAAAPGTNSLGTALSSSGRGKAMPGELLGTGPDIDREEAKVEKMIGSICRGC
jgi:hypothetical protein